MKDILFLESSFYGATDIKDAFMQLGYSVVEIPVPSQSEAEKTLYIHMILDMVKEYKPIFCFSLDFYPTVSLACGVLKMRYVSWLVKPYDKAYFDSSICGDWNHVFAANKTVAQKLIKMGQQHVQVLPLATSKYALSQKEITQGENTDEVNVLWTDFTDKFLDMDELEIKDASRGYIDATVACKSQYIDNCSVYEGFPQYVREDLIENELDRNENNSDLHELYWDYQCLLPAISMQTTKDILTIAQGMKVEISNNITVRDEYDGSIEDIHKKMQVMTNSSCNIFIGSYIYREMISPYMWELLGRGCGFITYSDTDFSVINNFLPIQIRKRAELFGEIKNQLVNKCKTADNFKEVLNKEIETNHLYINRVRQIITTI